MAVIQKIRNKYGKLAGAIIAIALVGFIFMDAASGRFGEFFGRNTNVAKVNGEKIDQKDYSVREKQYETIYDIMSNGKSIDDNTRAELNAQALQNMLFEKIADKVCDKLGIETTDEEKKEIIYGNYADPLVRQFPMFKDPETGQFDPRRVSGFEKQADRNDQQQMKMLDAWYSVKDYVIRNNQVSKLASLVVNTMYTPKYLVEHNAQLQGEKASISFVKVPFTTINDNEVKVSDDDIKAYMEKHKAMFMVTEPFRSIAYVSFDVVPSSSDTAKILAPLTQMKSDFENAKDNETFVNRNSDDPYRDMFVNKNTFKSRYIDTLVKMPVGAVYGPYFENGSYRLAKVVEKKDMPDTVKFRHILIVTRYQGKDILPDSTAKNRIDSIAGAAKSDSAWRILAEKYSDDGLTKNKGGEMTITLAQKGVYAKPVDSFLFNGKPGEHTIIKVDSADNQQYVGYHYIEIMDQKGVQPAVKLAIISKALFPSDSTDQAVYSKASEFAGKYGTAKAFDDGVIKDGYNKRLAENIKPSDEVIQGIGPDREIVRWAYSAKPGQVSQQIFSLQNPGRYIVAMLTDVQNKGMLEITPELRPRLEAVVRNEKKGDMILNKYKGSSSLEAIAQASKQQVLLADSFNFSALYLPNLGMEPKVIGYTFYKGLAVNTVSPGIKGMDGVFYIKVGNRWTVPLGPGVLKLEERQEMMKEEQMKNDMNDALRQLMLRDADVKYYPDNI